MRRNWQLKRPLPKKVMQRKAICRVQERLNRISPKLKLTGRMDQATRRALVRFQKEHNLAPTGRINALTLSKLGLPCVP